MKEKIILDCDPGTDDSVCIVMALTHPSIELVAITAESGNLLSSTTSENALKVLEHFGRTDIPVSQGMLHPLIRKAPADPYYHGKEGLGNFTFPKPKAKTTGVHAALSIINEVNRHPHEISLICTAPLTNVALAMMIDPSIVGKIKKIYHLGGSYGFSPAAFQYATGDTPMSEWNIYVDPEAARIVYSSGVPLLTIGLDIAYGGKTDLTDDTVARIKALGTKQSEYVTGILEYIEAATKEKDIGFRFRGTLDTTAMCAFLCPEMLTTQRIKVAIDTSSSFTRGMTLWDQRVWTTRHLSPWDEFFEIESVSDIDKDLFQETYYKAVAGEA